MTSLAALGLLLLAATAFWAGQRRALQLAPSSGGRLHSRPVYHGALVALACALPGLALLAVEPRIALAVAALAAAGAWRRIAPELRARPQVEVVVRALLAACSLVAILATIGIVLSLLFEAARFFDRVSVGEFLFGLEWSPQTAFAPTGGLVRRVRRGAGARRDAADRGSRDGGGGSDRPLLRRLHVRVCE
jgi:phosphate transport system permease protein